MKQVKTANVANENLENEVKTAETVENVSTEQPTEQTEQPTEQISEEEILKSGIAEIKMEYRKLKAEWVSYDDDFSQEARETRAKMYELEKGIKFREAKLAEIDAEKAKAAKMAEAIAPLEQLVKAAKMIESGNFDGVTAEQANEAFDVLFNKCKAAILAGVGFTQSVKKAVAAEKATAEPSTRGGKTAEILEQFKTMYHEQGKTQKEAEAALRAMGYNDGTVNNAVNAYLRSIGHK